MPSIRGCAERNAMTPVDPCQADPAAVMEKRLCAQRDGDFSVIFETSHRLSALRRSFDRLIDYVDYARKELSGQVTVHSWEILKTEIGDDTAYVLLQVALSVHGQSESYIEIAELRFSQQAWRHLCSWRLAEEFSADQALQADLPQLLAHPDTVVF